MAQLILTLLGLAVAAAMTLSSLNYGGTAVTAAVSKANAQAIISAAQQIANAAAMFEVTNGGIPAADVQTLVSAGFLTSVPVFPAGVTGKWELSAKHAAAVRLEGLAEAACSGINQQMGLPAQVLPAPAATPIYCYRSTGLSVVVRR